MEIWKDIKGYEGYYQVSNLGNVKSLDRVINHVKNSTRLMRGKLLKGSTDGYGYKIYYLSKNGKINNFRGHVLVAMHFLNHEPCGFKVVVDHIDGNPSNNNLKNLQLISHRENIMKGFVMRYEKEKNKS